MLGPVLSLLLAVPPSLAAPGLTVVGDDAQRAEGWNEHLAQHFTGFRVVTAGDMKNLLGLERQRELLGCNGAASCIAELGSALGVQGLVVGSVTRVEDGWRVTLKVIAPGDGRVLASRSGAVFTEAELFDALAQAGREMAVDTKRALALEPSPEEVRLAAPAPSAARKAWWVPLASGAALSGVGVGLLLTAEARYTQLTHATFPSREAALAVSGEGKLFTGLGWAAVGMGTAAVISGVVMLLFGGDAAPALHAWLTPHGGGVLWGGTWP